MYNLGGCGSYTLNWEAVLYREYFLLKVLNWLSLVVAFNRFCEHPSGVIACPLNSVEVDLISYFD